MSDLRKNNGGRRLGAGRKAVGEPRETMTLYLPVSVAGELRRLAKVRGTPIGAVVAELTLRADVAELFPESSENDRNALVHSRESEVS